MEKLEKVPVDASEKKVYSTTLRNTFLSSYFILLGYTGLTLIEAIRTPFAHVRHIMNIETTVSIIAGLFYGLFNEEMKKDAVDLKKINELRYLDWSITTPLILLALLLFYNEKSSIDSKTFLQLISLNGGMLLTGYLGETGTISKPVGAISGFAFYLALLYLFYSCCVPKSSNQTVFWVFAVIWALYGVNYMIEEEETKNIGYNVLDVASKALFGVVLWMYFGHILKF